MQLSTKQTFILKLSVVGLLMGAAILSRFWLVDWPNFKPVMAVALYAGFLLGNRWWTWMVPLMILALSDLFIGFYDGLLMASVYLSMMVAVGAGQALARWTGRREWRPLGTMVGMGVAALLVSVVFFLTTNAAVVLAGWYPRSLSGLTQSYLAGLPFFRFTLAGNCLFSLLLFTSHFAVQAIVVHRRSLAQVRAPGTSTTV